MTAPAPIPHRILLALLILLPAMLVAAGCGDDEPASEDTAAEQAEAEERSAEREAEQAYLLDIGRFADDLGTVSEQMDAAEDWTAAGEAADELEALIDRLRELEPPAAVADDHAELVAAMDRMLAANRQITSTSSEETDAAAMREIDESAEVAGEAVERILEDLLLAGYS